MTAYSAIGKRSLTKPKVHLCLCGEPAVGAKRPGGFWSCQGCLDKDDVYYKHLAIKAKRRLAEDLVLQP